MIVISIPRCGGTKFTYDLSIKHNLQFVGETKSIYVSNYLKHKPSKPYIHELPNQVMFDENYWIDTIINPQKYAILANHRDISMLFPIADYFLMRRSFNNMIGAYLKWLDMNEVFYNTTYTKEVRKMEIYYVIHNIYAICLWCKKTNKKITWYEDHFHTPDYILDENLNFYVSMINHTNLEELFVEVGGTRPQYFNK